MRTENLKQVPLPLAFATLADAFAELDRMRVQSEQLDRSLRDIAPLQATTDQRAAECTKSIVTLRSLIDAGDADAALKHIEEILANVVGTEDFVVLLLNADVMRVVAGMGEVVDRFMAGRLAWEEVEADAVRVVPLYRRHRVAGAIVIRGLLHHRGPLDKGDEHVLWLLSQHALAALSAGRTSRPCAGNGRAA